MAVPCLHSQHTHNSFANANRSDLTLNSEKRVRKMTLCMLHNEGIFSNKFSEFEVFASRQSAFLISEFLHVSARVPDLPKICNIWDTLRSIISRVSQISQKSDTSGTRQHILSEDWKSMKSSAFQKSSPCRRSVFLISSKKLNVIFSPAPQPTASLITEERRVGG